MEKNKERIKRQRRLIRTRSKVLNISKTGVRPRLSVFRSHKHFYAQIIDDSKGKTIISVNEKEIDSKEKLIKCSKAIELGKILAGKAKKVGIKKVVFDKGHYKYHGRVKHFAQSAREGGLEF